MGQTISSRVKCGNSAAHQLCASIREGDLDFVERVIKEEPKLLNSSFFYNRLTPLHVAASHGQLQVLSVLLNRGADPNACTHTGQTPLMLACKSGRWSCIDPLLDSGANVLTFDYTRARTCLHYAAKAGHTECVRRILVAARQSPIANSWGFVRFVNVRDGNGTTPLHMASRAGHAAVVSLLLESGALVSASTTTAGNGPGHGSAPIHFAARGGSVSCVRELLAWGADRSQRDLVGYTPYGIAMKYNNTACAALLNPNVAEPLVWPSPWKFMSELGPEAKMLLEAALAQANDEREKQLSRSSHGMAEALVASSHQDCKKEKDEEAREASPLDDPIETGGMGIQEVCCICFEQFCTIEVKECGHQMCATCTLSLCCHSKPNPAIPYSPPPSCPFCRRNIGQLILATPKPKLLLDPSRERKSRRSRRSGGSRHSSRGSSVGKGSFSGPFSGPFIQRLSSNRGSTTGRSGRIADIDWLNRF